MWTFKYPDHGGSGFLEIAGDYPRFTDNFRSLEDRR